jgi:hypothetical protein
VVKYATRPKTRQQQEQIEDQENARIMEIVADLKERMKRKVMRQLRKGEIDYDPKIDKLIYTDSKEEFIVEAESDIDSEDF